MTRMFLTLAAVAAFFTWSHAAEAQKPSGRSSGIFGKGEPVQGFTRNGEQGIGLFGPAGGARAQHSSTQRNRAQQYGARHYVAQQFGGPNFPGTSAFSVGYRPQLQTNLQYQLQVPYPSQQNGVSYSYSEDGELQVRPVIMGNPANSLVPAGAFGFGPGAIYGW